MLQWVQTGKILKNLQGMIRHAQDMSGLWPSGEAGSIQRTQDKGGPLPWQDLVEQKVRKPVF